MYRVLGPPLVAAGKQRRDRERAGRGVHAEVRQPDGLVIGCRHRLVVFALEGRVIEVVDGQAAAVKSSRLANRYRKRDGMAAPSFSTL